MTHLDTALASTFARLALAGIEREYPHKPEHVLNGPDDARLPRELHPAFYGCYDWHSAVHTHWMLASLARSFPDLPEAPEIRRVLRSHLTPQNMAAEIRYLTSPNRISFERGYGWAWLWCLAAELRRWPDPEAAAWFDAVKPLASLLAQRYVDYLLRQTYPIRAGTHANTAFALALAWDYGIACDDSALCAAVRAASLKFYERDQDGPAAYEPGGNDFLSPCLTEAWLMTRHLDANAFALWLAQFLPSLQPGKECALWEPATVSDRADPQGVHLDGLNLSRAWCLAAMARALPQGDGRSALLSAAAGHHLSAGLAHVSSGDFLAEHWLGTFVVYALQQGGGQRMERPGAL